MIQEYNAAIDRLSWAIARTSAEIKERQGSEVCNGLKYKLTSLYDARRELRVTVRYMEEYYNKKCAFCKGDLHNDYDIYNARNKERIGGRFQRLTPTTRDTVTEGAACDRQRANGATERMFVYAPKR